MLTLAKAIGPSVTVTPTDEVRKDAVIFAVVFAVSTFVVTLKVAEVAPPATVTVVGTVAALELLDNLMAKPPVGAAEASVTAPVNVVPPTAVSGVTVRPLINGVLIVKLALEVLFPDVAFMTATVFADTG